MNKEEILKEKRKEAVRVEQEYTRLGMTAPMFQKAVDIASQDWTNWKKRGVPKGKLSIVSDIIKKPIDWIVTGKENYIEGQVNQGDFPSPESEKIPPVISEEEWKAISPKTRALVEEILIKSGNQSLQDDDIKLLQDMADKLSKK